MGNLENYNAREAAALQKQYCAKKGVKMFAPENGKCKRCYQNIYTPIKHLDGDITGYDLTEARTHQITTCPHCYKSFIG